MAIEKPKKEDQLISPEEVKTSSVGNEAGNKDLLERLDAQEKKIEQLEKSNKKAKGIKEDKKDNGELIKPVYKKEELTDKMPKDKFFNKVRSYNGGTKQTAIPRTDKVDYLHIYEKGKKYTFWKGLNVTKEQEKEIPKEIINRLCGLK